MGRPEGIFMTALLCAGVLFGAGSQPFYADIEKVSVGEQLFEAVTDTENDGIGETFTPFLATVGTDGRLSIKDGMAQPMLIFADASVPNEESDILRFCVYVETDHDTDGDGMADLVKVFCQVPKGAASGKYKAGVIYDPIPYTVGTTEGLSIDKIYRFTPEGFDYKELYADGRKRQPKGELNTTGVALTADSSDWMYSTPLSEVNLVNPYYDYFLTRGFAVVTSSGIGTYGSEGYELCGMDLERDAHKCVVEWLAGDRIAYTDFESDIRIKADWSNKKVAMTGISYGGTLPFEVATTGVRGLKTIIPVAGIASWYDYVNSQGVSTASEGNYTDALAFFNSGAALGDVSWIVGDERYGAYLKQVRKDEKAAYGDYTDIWESKDYTKDYEDIRCSAFIVHGLNDFNVMPIHMEKMYNAFKKAGQETKLILHQGAHEYPYGHKFDGVLFEDILNKWLCHYLYDIDNGIQDMPEVMVQSNVDGEFLDYDTYGDVKFSDVGVEFDDDTFTVKSQDYDSFYSRYPDLDEVSMETYVTDLLADEAQILDTGLKEGDTIFGAPRLKVKLKPDKDVTWYEGKDGDAGERPDELLLDNLMVAAYLIDTVDEGDYYHAYIANPTIEDIVPMKIVGNYIIGEGHQDYDIYEYLQTPTDIKVVSWGAMDLCNPGKGNEMSRFLRDENFEFDEYYDYTLYFQPTHYTLQPGHKLKLVILAQDLYFMLTNPEVESLDLIMKEYEFEIDNTSIEMEMPVVN